VASAKCLGAVGNGQALAALFSFLFYAKATCHRLELFKSCILTLQMVQEYVPQDPLRLNKSSSFEAKSRHGLSSSYCEQRAGHLAEQLLDVSRLTTVGCSGAVPSCVHGAQPSVPKEEFTLALFLSRVFYSCRHLFESGIFASGLHVR
jgi:hypothetical protein